MDLYEHRVLTTIQIFELHFNSYHRARQRLLELLEMGLVTRYRPHRPTGSFPWHYVLDQTGAHVVAGAKGIELQDLGYRKERAFQLATSPVLAHIRERNGFMSRLAWGLRRAGPGFQLLKWLNEFNSRREFGEMVRPDALAAVRGNDRSRSFFLEFDRGTERLSRIEEKLHSYQTLSGFPGLPDCLLFCFRTPEREASVRKVLWNPGMTVATTSIERHCDRPLGPVWGPMETRERAGLLDIPKLGAGPYEGAFA